MPYRCDMCNQPSPVEILTCAQCGCDRIVFFKDPEIIRVEFHYGGYYVSVYKDGFFGYSQCRIFGEAARFLHRDKQFEIMHPDDQTWMIRGCEDVDNPTLINGREVDKSGEMLKNRDVLSVGKLQMKVVFVCSE